MNNADIQYIIQKKISVQKLFTLSSTRYLGSQRRKQRITHRSISLHSWTQSSEPLATKMNEHTSNPGCFTAQRREGKPQSQHYTHPAVCIWHPGCPDAPCCQSFSIPQSPPQPVLAVNTIILKNGACFCSSKIASAVGVLQRNRKEQGRALARKR